MRLYLKEGVSEVIELNEAVWVGPKPMTGALGIGTGRHTRAVHRGKSAEDLGEATIWLAKGRGLGRN